MAKNKFKRAVSFVMAAVLSLTTFMGLGTTTAFAASGTKSNVYIMELPRSGDANNKDKRSDYGKRRNVSHCIGRLRTRHHYPFSQR